MSVASGQLDSAGQAPSRPAAVTTRILVVVFLVTSLVGLVDAGRRIGDLDRRRDQARSAHVDAAAAAGGVADAFRRARSSLHAGDRFAVVFPGAIGRDLAGHYRLVALSSLYPGIAVPDGAHADLVMVFGEPPAPIRTTFAEVGVVSGIWIGRRHR